MKKLKMILTSLLTVCMLFGSSVISVFAAEEYTYTVTLYAGNQGTFPGGEDKVVITDLKSGDRVKFDQLINSLTVADSNKYYVKGIRQSGRDNNDVVNSPDHRVVGDKDFVVAYGIKGDMVGYTVRYHDEEGNELLPSSTYYGNVGDKPVVAYQYVENYTPQVTAYTKTLVSNEAENVFTFIYSPVTTETVTVPGETTTVTTVIPGPTTTETTVIETPAPETPAAADTEEPAAEEETPAGEEAGEEPGTAETDEGAEVIEPEEVPQGEDVVDLDEEETPRAESPEETKEKVKKGLPLAAGIAIGVGAVAALSALAVFLIKRRR